MSAGKAWAKINGASADVKLSELTSHFQFVEIEQYIAKLDSLNITDPYNAPVYF